MNFRRATRRADEPEINFIPLIDLLLVVLIFVLVTTTYASRSFLGVDLPQAASEAGAARRDEIVVAVGRDGRYAIADEPVAWRDADSFAARLRLAATGHADPLLVVQADAAATHQAVVHVLEAARVAGLSRVTFATRPPT